MQAVANSAASAVEAAEAADASEQSAQEAARSADAAEQSALAAEQSALAALRVSEIASGSYVGDGKYGETNPNSLTFNFKPMVIMFYGRVRDDANTGRKYLVTALCDSGEYFCPTGANQTYGRMSVSGNTVSWYTTNTQDAHDEEKAPLVPCSQMNGDGETYHYVAIGRRVEGTS